LKNAACMCSTTPRILHECSAEKRTRHSISRATASMSHVSTLDVLLDESPIIAESADRMLSPSVEPDDRPELDPVWGRAG